MTRAWADDGPALVIFDLDRTLTRYDTYVAYLAGYVLRHPWRLLPAFRLPYDLLLYLAGRLDRTELKQRALRSVLGGAHREAIERWTARFVTNLSRRGFRQQALAVLEAHRQRGDRLVLLTGSLDFYANEIGRRLGFHQVISSEAEWVHDRLSGRLRGPNQRGEAKVTSVLRLRARFGHTRLIAYADHISDLPLLQLADRALLVNGSSKARQEAMRVGIPCCGWD